MLVFRWRQLASVRPWLTWILIGDSSQTTSSPTLVYFRHRRSLTRRAPNDLPHTVCVFGGRIERAAPFAALGRAGLFPQLSAGKHNCAFAPWWKSSKAAVG